MVHGAVGVPAESHRKASSRYETCAECVHVERAASVHVLALSLAHVCLCEYPPATCAYPFYPLAVVTVVLRLLFRADLHQAKKGGKAGAQARRKGKGPVKIGGAGSASQMSPPGAAWASASAGGVSGGSASKARMVLLSDSDSDSD